MIAWRLISVSICITSPLNRKVFAKQFFALCTGWAKIGKTFRRLWYLNYLADIEN